MQQNGHQNEVFVAGGSTNIENPLNNSSVWQTKPYMCYYDLYVCQYMKVSICWKFKFVSDVQLLFILLEKMFIAMKTEISMPHEMLRTPETLCICLHELLQQREAGN